MKVADGKQYGEFCEPGELQNYLQEHVVQEASRQILSYDSSGLLTVPGTRSEHRTLKTTFVRSTTKVAVSSNGLFCETGTLGKLVPVSYVPLPPISTPASTASAVTLSDSQGT